MMVDLPKKLLAVIGAVAVLNVLVLGLGYALYPGYVDTGEPNIVALAWRILDGHPVYLSIQDETRITNLYGPFLYLIHALVFSVFGGSVVVGKATAIAALFIALVMACLSQRARGSVAIFVMAGGLSAIIVMNLPASVWDRPDAFMLMSVALGLWLNNRANSNHKWRRVFLFGLLIGFLIGMKIFAAIYFLPFGLLMLYRDGIAACCVTVLIAFAVTAIPFMTPVFEFRHMVDLIGVMADKPNSWIGLEKVLRYATVYLIPPAIFLGLGIRMMARHDQIEAGILAVGTLIAIVLVLYPAQKPGAGMHYLLPFAPIVLDLMNRGLNVARERYKLALTLALFIVILINVISIPIEKRFVRGLDWEMANGVAEEIHQISKDFDGHKIEIGIGDTNESYKRTYQRTRLVFEGHPYTLDTAIIIDTTFWGLELTQGTLDMIERCQTDIWLIPADERPFKWIGYYGNDTYGQPFRDSFARAFEKTESRTYFDIYRCKSSQ